MYTAFFSRYGNLGRNETLRLLFIDFIKEVMTLKKKIQYPYRFGN
jgi:hypothetical protein